MLGWFHKLLPREEKFFDLFERHSETVVAGAEALRALLDGGEAVPRHYQTIMDREQDADNITREVLIAVRRTFITPFDRGDIKDLITAMDNAIDQMQKTAKGVMLFDQREFTPCMREMGDAVVTCAKLVREAMPLMKSINSRGDAPLGDHRGDRRARRQGRRPARFRPARSVSGQCDRLRDDVHHRQRGLRSSREGGRPLRRRRQPHPRHRDRSCVISHDGRRSRSRCRC